MEVEEKAVNKVIEQLSALEPTAADAPQSARAAFAHLQQRLQRPSLRQPSSRLHRPFYSERSITMSNRKSWVVGLATLLILALLFTFPSVRAAASDFLGLFRVQKFAAVSVSPERLEMLEQLMDQGLMPGEFEVLNEPGALTPVSSIEEGEALTGLSVRTISTLGEPEEIYLVDGGNGRLTIDLEAARAIMETVGADPLLLPDDLDGQQVHVAIFDAVRQEWGDGTALMQSESPYAEYPDNVNPTLLGEALLQVLGVEPDSARNMAQSIDWTSTFLLPIPQGMASFSEVTIDGATGAAMTAMDEDAALLWQKDGKVHLLTGPKSVEELISLANSLQ
jgi:hypothetical protein